jgi:hypothetical protein
MSTPLEWKRGDTLKALQVTIKDSAGVAVNLTGGTVRLQAKSNDGPIFAYQGLLSTTSGVANVTRSAGNFTTDGVQVGQFLTGSIASRFPANATISAVGTSTLTMSATALSTSSSESGGVQGATFDLAGTLTDAVNGICSFAAVGNAISVAQMGSRASSLFNANVKFTTGGGSIGYSANFPVAIVAAPL